MTSGIPTQSLEQMIADHELWLSSGRIEGKGGQLDLEGASIAKEGLAGRRLDHAICRNCDFRGADLAGASLIGATLDGADFSSAKLDEADLRYASCRGTKFCGADGSSGADLRGAVLWDADLTGADLSGASGLAAASLGRSLLLGSRLPRDIAGFEALSQVEEISKNASRIFFLLISACLYSWLSIGTTKDFSLISDKATIALPIIGTPLQASGFYWAAPIVLVGVYLYFLLYLQRLWRELRGLPAIFPDGKALDEKAYPWLLNGLVRAKFARLAIDDRPLTLVETRIAFVLAWLLVPLTIAGFWLRYLPRHDWAGSSFHALLVIASLGIGLSAYGLAAETLAGRRMTAIGHKREPRSLAARLAAPLGANMQKGHLTSLAAGCLIVIGLTIAAAVAPGNDPLSRLGFNTGANLKEAQLSVRLPGWKPGSKENVNGIDLRGRDLRGAQASGAFLVDARLDGADLRGADFSEAQLTGASLVRADLRGAKFDAARLDGEAVLGSVKAERASFKGADLSGARLHFAQLCGSFFDDANASGADMGDANLAGARFVDAQLVGTIFAGASLVGADLDGGSNLAGADFEGADLCRARFPGPPQPCRDGRSRHPVRMWPRTCLDPNVNALTPD